MNSSSKFLKLAFVIFVIVATIVAPQIIDAQQILAPILFGGTAAPICLIAHGGAGGTNSATTGALNTTGANLLVASLGSQVRAMTLTDSKGNTWLPLAFLTGDLLGNFIQQYYCYNCTVGAGHTFTQTDAGGAGTIFVTAWCNVANPAFEQQGGDVDTNGQPSPVLPFLDNSLIITSVILGNPASVTGIDHGFTITDNIAFSAGVNFGGAMAYSIQTSKTSTQPQWMSTGAGGSTGITVFRGITPTGSYLVSYTFTSGVNGGTSGPITTTTANLLVAYLTGGNGVTPTISDSKGNTWVPLNLNGNAGCCAGSKQQFWYVASPTVGTGHTFTLGGAGVAGTLHVAAMAGMNAVPFDVQDVGTGTNVTNTITPSVNGDWIFAGFTVSTLQACVSASNNFGFVSSIAYQGATNYGGCLVYFHQTTAAGINTTFFPVGGAGQSNIVAFKQQ